MGRKLGGLCPVRGGGAGSPPNTMWPGPRRTCMPSFILIRPTVWPQYTNVADRQDRQRTDSIGRTVLQTVAQKSFVGRGSTQTHRALPHIPYSCINGPLCGEEGRNGNEGKRTEKEREGEKGSAIPPNKNRGYTVMVQCKMWLCLAVQ